MPTVRFDAPTAAQRQQWLSRLGDRAAHDEIASGLRCLHDVEAVRPPTTRAAEGWLRVAAWNVERGRRLEEAAALLASTAATVVLVSEADSGMARSNNRDVPRELADALGMGYAYGIEFVELGLGDAREAEASSGRRNERGLHGNAILSVAGLLDPRVLRLDAGGDWFTADRGQPRIGGRMAVLADVELDGTTVTLASVHLESASTAGERASQFATVLDAVDARATAAGTAVVGGDLNTFGAPLADLADRSRVRALRAADPARFTWPPPYEPLFDEAAARGYEFVDANLAAPTTRHGGDALPDHPPLHLDWILVRGLEARRPAVVPAIAGDGSALSDHELVAVSVRLPR